MKKLRLISSILLILIFMNGCAPRGFFLPYANTVSSESPTETLEPAVPEYVETVPYSENTDYEEIEEDPEETEEPIEIETEEDTEETDVTEDPEDPDFDSDNDHGISEEHSQNVRPVEEHAGVDSLLETMTLREKVLQMMLLAPVQLDTSLTVADDALQETLQEMPVGGFILFPENIEDRDQVMSYLAGCQKFSRIGMFLSTDEEGGTVSRLGDCYAMDFPTFSDCIYTWGWEEAYERGNTIGSEMRRLGFNLDFAPVADVNSNPYNPIIGDRSFSSDPEDAANLVNGCVTGFLDAGISCTLKHFPGHGDTDSDTHYGEAACYKTMDELWDCELIPFVSGIQAGAPFIMMAHITLPNVVDDYTPASLSWTVTTGLLRQQLGYHGIIITDALNMGAIANVYSSGEAAVLAIEAGADILLMPNNPYAALEGVLDAVNDGRIPESRIDESVRRILNQKAAMGLL